MLSWLAEVMDVAGSISVWLAALFLVLVVSGAIVRLIVGIVGSVEASLDRQRDDRREARP